MRYALTRIFVDNVYLVMLLSVALVDTIQQRVATWTDQFTDAQLAGWTLGIHPMLLPAI
jgi:hypothetical protein